MAASEKDIENIIKMLDEASATTARINLNVAEDGNDGEIRKLKHHGRCDVGSAWAGTVHAGLGNGLFAAVHAPVGTPVTICKSLHNQLSLSI